MINHVERKKATMVWLDLKLKTIKIYRYKDEILLYDDDDKFITLKIITNKKQVEYNKDLYFEYKNIFQGRIDTLNRVIKNWVISEFSIPIDYVNIYPMDTVEWVKNNYL